MDDLARTERIAWEVVEGRPADDAARAMCDVLGSCDAYAALVDPCTGQGAGEGFAYLDPALVELLATEFATPETSPFIRAMPRMRPGMFHHCSQILNMKGIYRTPFYQDWWIPSGVRDHAGGIMLPAPDGRLAYVVIGCLGDRDWLDADELRFAEAACSGVARALRTAASLAHREVTSLVDAVAPDPCWVLGADGHVHMTNAPAQELMPSSPVRRRNGAIVLSEPDAGTRLDVLLAAVLAGGRGGAIVVTDGDGFARLTVEPGPTYRDERTALVTLRSPEPMEWSVDELQAAMDLAPREAEAAIALASGAGTSEIARTLGVSSETVRIYLKRGYAKLGVHDRGALVALLLRGRRE